MSSQPETWSTNCYCRLNDVHHKRSKDRWKELLAKHKENNATELGVAHDLYSDLTILFTVEEKTSLLRKLGMLKDIGNKLADPNDEESEIIRFQIDTLLFTLDKECETAFKLFPNPSAEYAKAWSQISKQIDSERQRLTEHRKEPKTWEGLISFLEKIESRICEQITTTNNALSKFQVFPTSSHHGRKHHVVYIDPDCHRPYCHCCTELTISVAIDFGYDLRMWSAVVGRNLDSSAPGLESAPETYSWRSTACSQNRLIEKQAPQSKKTHQVTPQPESLVPVKKVKRDHPE